MKKFVFLLGIIFCVNFAADAQLRYQNGQLRLNVPENYRFVSGKYLYQYTSSLALKTDTYLFLGDNGGEFYLRPVMSECVMLGPTDQGYIEFCTETSQYHYVTVQSLYNNRT